MSPYVDSLTLLATPPPLSSSPLLPYRYMKDLGVRCDHLGRVSLEEFIKCVLCLSLSFFLSFFLSLFCLYLSRFIPISIYIF